MPVALANNLGMWWSKRITPPSADLAPLARERVALERFIAESDNVTVAELAKIRLRVVRFLLSRDASSSDADPDEAAPQLDLIALDLPRTHAPVHTAHLVNVVAKTGTLDALHRLNAERYDRPAAIPLTRFPFGLERAASATFWILLFLAVVVMIFAISDAKSADVGILLVAAFPFVLFGIILSKMPALTARQASLVGPVGIESGGRVYHLEKLAEVRLYPAVQSAEIQLVLTDGSTRSSVISSLIESGDDWAHSIGWSMLTERPELPIYINDVPLLETPVRGAGV